MNDALDVVVDGERTLREWLRDVLLTLWQEGEGFSPKRPLGNSGYYTQITEALEAEGYEDPEATVAQSIRDVFDQYAGTPA